MKRFGALGLTIFCLVPAATACGDGGRTALDGPGLGPAGAPAAAPLFRDVTIAWGISCSSSLEFTGDFPIAEIMGHGVCVLDADGDDVPDLYFANAGPRPTDRAPDRLYLGLPGGGFRDATEGSGLVADGWSTGLAVGDIDNDGDDDLYVGAWGADRLFRNEGGGRFTDISAPAGIAGDRLTASVAFLDHDEDGFLDIFVVHYVVPNPDRVCGGTGGGREYCAPAAYAPDADTLWRNRGDGTFEDVSAAAGIASEASSGLGVVIADLDADGHVDVFVANDQRPNQLWRNRGDGTFEEVALQRGAALSGRGNAEASMGVAVADVNGDGRLDVFVSHLAGESNTLYLSDTHGAFRDASTSSGVGASSRPYTGFGTALVDLDLNGWPDLVIANGRVVRGERYPSAALPPPFDLYAEPNHVFLNDGKGRFQEATGAGAAFCGRAELSRGLALGDLDRDGDQDVVVTNIGGPARVYENVAPRAGRWLVVEAHDRALHRSLPGARVVVRAGDRSFVAAAAGNASYLSASQQQAHFGLGDVDAVEGIDVIWPGGLRETFAGGAPDRRVRVFRGEGESR